MRSLVLVGIVAALCCVESFAQKKGIVKPEDADDRGKRTQGLSQSVAALEPHEKVVASAKLANALEDNVPIGEMVVLLCGLVNNADADLHVLGIGGTITPLNNPESPFNLTFLQIEQTLPQDAEGTYSYDFRVPNDFAQQEVQLSLTAVYTVGGQFYKTDFYNNKVSFVQTSFAGSFSSSDLLRIGSILLTAVIVTIGILSNTTDNQGKPVAEILGLQESKAKKEARKAGDWGDSAAQLEASIGKKVTKAD